MERMEKKGRRFRNGGISERPDKTYTFESMLDFGKHQGETIEDVSTYDVQYLIWCLDNVKFFKVSESDKRVLHRLNEESITHGR